ncbi:hypothetical protein HanPSC8_Chr17g0762261 [Helianthus annuus]|nr:hypothetical protein HanPSC8_Chr17g0762261 [Helianthus annuus]
MWTNPREKQHRRRTSSVREPAPGSHSPTHERCMIPTEHALFIQPDKASIAITNKNGERGSPCLRHR